MKKLTILYWVFTTLFSAAILFSAIPDIIVTSEALSFITALGYPAYIVPFLGVAKTLGVIAIVVPGFARLKEWAYAGIFFDLVGATYSNIAKYGFHVSMLVMLIFFGLLFLSYYYHHKRVQQVNMKFATT
jgi:hypothetical protein